MKRRRFTKEGCPDTPDGCDCGFSYAYITNN